MRGLRETGAVTPSPTAAIPESSDSSDERRILMQLEPSQGRGTERAVQECRRKLRPDPPPPIPAPMSRVGREG